MLGFPMALFRIGAEEMWKDADISCNVCVSTSHFSKCKALVQNLRSDLTCFFLESNYLKGFV